jgi:TctA family transporter
MLPPCAALSGCALVSCLAVVPAVGLAAYALKKYEDEGEAPGQGNIRGAEAPESANNAGS